jgi:hypothetical protein
VATQPKSANLSSESRLITLRGAVLSWTAEKRLSPGGLWRCPKSLRYVSLGICLRVFLISV